MPVKEDNWPRSGTGVKPFLTERLRKGSDVQTAPPQRVAHRLSTDYGDAASLLADAWPPLQSPSTVFSSRSSAPDHCEPLRCRSPRRLVCFGVMTVVVFLCTMLMVSMTNMNCTYISKGGRLCQRPGQMHPYGTPLGVWLRSLQPPRIGFASLQEGGSDENGERAPPAALPSRKKALRIEEELSRRMSRSWASILAAAEAEDQRTARGEEGEEHVPLYLRYLAAVHHDADPNGNHHDLLHNKGNGAQTNHHETTPLRVRVVTVTNQIDTSLCSLHASAALVGVPLVTLGLEEEYSGPGRYEKILAFVEREGLRDGDTLLYLDSDTFFSGEDLVPLLEKFMRLSPSSEAELDPALTRAWEDYGEVLAPLFAEHELGRSHHKGTAEDSADECCASRTSLLQMPPIVYNTERYCFLGDLMEGEKECTLAYALMEATVERERNRTPDYVLHPNDGDTVPPWLAERVPLREGLAEHSSVPSQLRPPRRRAKQRRVLHIAANVSLFALMDGRSRRDPPSSNPVRESDPVEQGGGADAASRGAPRSHQKDPFFYRKNSNAELNAARYINSGVALMRVWAFKRLVSSMREFMATHQARVWTVDRLARAKDPVGYRAAAAFGDDQHLVRFVARAARAKHVNSTGHLSATEGRLPRWRCDQSIVSAFYLLGRMWEIEKGLLSAAGPASRLGSGGPPRIVAPFAIPAGLQGLDRRSEFFFVTTDSVYAKDYSLTDDYRVRVCSAAGDCARHTPRVARSGAILTPPLFHVYPTPEDVLRRLYSLTAALSSLPPLPSSNNKRVASTLEVWRHHYNALPSLMSKTSSPTVFFMRPAVFHTAGGWKTLYYTMYRNALPWFAATRSGNSTVTRRSRAILDHAVVEAWGPSDVLLIPFKPLCGYPFPLH